MRPLSYRYHWHCQCSVWCIVIGIVSNIHAIYNEEQICKDNVEQKGTKY